MRRWNSAEFREQRYRNFYLAKYKDDEGMVLLLKQLWQVSNDPWSLARLIEHYRHTSPRLVTELFFKSGYRLFEDEAQCRYIRVILCSGNTIQGGLFSDSSPDFEGR